MYIINENQPIAMADKLCTVKGCPFNGRYCRVHKAAKIITRVVINKVSEPRKELNKKYTKLSKIKKGEKTECEIRIPGVCTGKIQGYNHPAGKHSAERLLNLDDGKFCCNACNTWCEDHPKEAMELGYIKKRNTKMERSKI